jgi:putative addiction module CopG family antidote
MPGHERSVLLPPDLADYVEAQVTAGAYASAEAVVRAGLEALQERDGTLEAWIVQEVLPVHDRLLQDPGRAIPLDAIEDMHRRRVTGG